MVTGIFFWDVESITCSSVGSRTSLNQVESRHDIQSHKTDNMTDHQYNVKLPLYSYCYSVLFSHGHKPGLTMQLKAVISLWSCRTPSFLITSAEERIQAAKKQICWRRKKMYLIVTNLPLRSALVENLSYHCRIYPVSPGLHPHNLLY